MHKSLLIHYAAKSVAPELRVTHFVESEPRLTWSSLFLQDHPEAHIYLVGGTVRDILRGNTPNDIDLVIQGVEQKKIQRWLMQQGAVRFVGKRFGTVKFAPHGCRDSQTIDIALPRQESIGKNHLSKRTGQNIQTNAQLNIEDDLARRDFTINAIAFDIESRMLIDPFGGMDDLMHQLIRTVLNPHERFYEDATRLLRGLRFAAQLQFGIEKETWQAIQANIDLLQNKTLAQDGTYTYVIPRDAIGKEFLLGFITHPVHTLNLWDQSGALNCLMPLIDKLKTIHSQAHGTAFEATKHLLHILQKPSFLAYHRLSHISPNGLIAALGAFLEHKKDILKLCQQCYFHQFPQQHPARVDCSIVSWLAEHTDLVATQDPANMRPSIFEKYFCTQKGRELVALIHALSMTEQKYSIITQRIHTIKQLLDRYDQAHYPKLLSGSDLIAIGLHPGPKFRELLDLVRDKQLTKKITTSEQALQFVREHIIKKS